MDVTDIVLDNHGDGHPKTSLNDRFEWVSTSDFLNFIGVAKRSFGLTVPIFY